MKSMSSNTLLNRNCSDDQKHHGDFSDVYEVCIDLIFLRNATYIHHAWRMWRMCRPYSLIACLPLMQRYNRTTLVRTFVCLGRILQSLSNAYSISSLVAHSNDAGRRWAAALMVWVDRTTFRDRQTGPPDGQRPTQATAPGASPFRLSAASATFV